ncbi:MAG: hypothetical protein GX330_02015 [Bacteroidales bacterium]|nr:hypothetical protein [Bacteroidales bacterium]
MAKKEELYIVKLMSTGKARYSNEIFPKKYNTFAVIKNGTDDIKEFVEKCRLQEQANYQSVNTCEVVTKVVSCQKILLSQILLTSNPNTKA